MEARYLLILLLAGCTVIGHQKVEGWPKLVVTEHHVPHHEMRDQCVPYVPWGSSPEACAVINLDKRTCDVWFSADFPPPPAFVKHERYHCEGYDHVGSDTLQKALKQWQQK